MSKLTQALDDLESSKSKKRVSAAKRLRKLAVPEAGPFLLKALTNELLTARTWEARYHMIAALGYTRTEESLSLLWKMAREKQDFTILYMALGDAIVRLSVSQRPLNAVLNEIYDTENFTLIYGAFRGIAGLKLVPTDDEILKIFEMARDPRAVAQVMGFPNDPTGIRLPIVQAAAGWKPELCAEFLGECQAMGNQHLNRFVTSSLNGKYEKYDPY